MRRVLAWWGAVAVGLLAGLGLAAAPASAHVTVSSANATQGGYAKLTFRVPNEKDSADTVTLEVNLPVDQPFPSVSVKPVPGWTVQTAKSKLATPIKRGDSELTEAVSKITWTAAAGAAVRPGQFQEFDVSVGPLPAVEKLVFKALQTYSDGDIVRWIEEPAADGKEAEHPAPTVKLARPAVDVGLRAAAVDVADDDARSRAAAGLWIGSVALGVALVGAVLGGLAVRRRSA